LSENKYIKGYILNEELVITPYRQRDVYVEDFFGLVYDGDIRFHEYLEIICKERGMKDHSEYFRKRKNDSKIAFQYYMIRLKAIDSFKYDSFYNCLSLFSQKFGFTDCAFFSTVFLSLFCVPSSILRTLLRTYLRIKYGSAEVETRWSDYIKSYPIGKGNTRIPYNSEEWKGDQKKLRGAI
jgi:hypothetical protein